MNAETVWIVLPPAGWVLWTLGGTTWKGWRRFIWPAVYGATLIWCWVPWPQAIGSALTLSAVACLGYGDKHSWLDRFGVGMAYAFPAVWFRPDAWWWLLEALVSGLGFILLMAASRRWNRITWKLIEGMVGLAQGIATSWMLTGRIG